MRKGKNESIVTIAHNISTKALPSLMRSKKLLAEQAEMLFDEFEKIYQKTLVTPTGKNFGSLLILLQNRLHDEFSEIYRSIGEFAESIEATAKQLDDKRKAVSRIMFEIYCDLTENFPLQEGFQIPNTDHFENEPSSHDSIAIQKAFTRTMRLQQGSNAELASYLISNGTEMSLSIRECIVEGAAKKVLSIPLDISLLDGLLDIVVSGFDPETRSCQVCLVRLATGKVKIKQYCLGPEDKVLPKNSMLIDPSMNAAFPSIGVWNTKFLDSDRGFTAVRVSDHSLFVFKDSVKEEAILKRTRQENHSPIESFAVCLSSPSTTSVTLSGNKVMLAILDKDSGLELQTSYGIIEAGEPKFTTHLERLDTPSKKLINKDIKFADTHQQSFLLVAGIQKESNPHQDPVLSVFSLKLQEISVGKHAKLEWQMLELPLEIDRTSGSFTETPRVRLNVQGGTKTALVRIDLGDLGIKRFQIDETGQLKQVLPKQKGFT